MLLVQAGLKYGPDIVLEITSLLKKSDATIADVEALFGKIKTYEQFEIPELVLKPKP